MITPIAAASAIQMPTPRPAKKKSSGTEMTRIRTKIVPSAPSATVSRLCGSGRGRLDPQLAQDEHDHDGEADEEDELPEDAGVPAEHRDRDAFAFAAVPAGEARDGEDEAGDDAEPVAEADDTGVEASFTHRHRGRVCRTR